nr:MAG TPA: hypothetical protein [Caudoviricetes sp.]DAP60051.1 MAG TPA: hypothetical protein [Caudoviricetes sp.]
MDNLEKLKFNLREEQTPYFTNEELLYLLEKNNNNVKKASYEGLILKAETTGLNVSGLTTKDSSSYFKMLASQYIDTNSGVLI